MERSRQGFFQNSDLPLRRWGLRDGWLLPGQAWASVPSGPALLTLPRPPLWLHRWARIHFALRNDWPLPSSWEATSKPLESPPRPGATQYQPGPCRGWRLRSTGGAQACPAVPDTSWAPAPVSKWQCWCLCHPRLPREGIVSGDFPGSGQLEAQPGILLDPPMRLPVRIVIGPFFCNKLQQ